MEQYSRKATRRLLGAVVVVGVGLVGVVEFWVDKVEVEDEELAEDEPAPEEWLELCGIGKGLGASAW